MAKWTQEQLNILKEHNGKGDTNFKELSIKVGHTLNGTRNTFYGLGYKLNTKNYWTQDQLKLLNEMYVNTPTKDLVKILQHPAHSIRDKALDLGLKKTEDARVRGIKKQNIFIRYETYYKMYTHDRKYYTYIDIEDFEKIKNIYWRMDGNGYFIHSFKDENNKSKRIQLHRYLVDCPINSDKEVDHINNKRYDNRKSNLRIVTHKINANNQSIGDGVLQVQEDLYRCIDGAKVLCEGTYAECKRFADTKKSIIMTDKDVDNKSMKQIENLFTLLSSSKLKKQCVVNLINIME